MTELQQTAPTIIRINLAEVPEFRRIELAKAVLAGMDELFSRPGEEEKYQKWLAERRAKQSKTKGGKTNGSF